MCFGLCPCQHNGTYTRNAYPATPTKKPAQILRFAESKNEPLSRKNSGKAAQNALGKGSSPLILPKPFLISFFRLQKLGAKKPGSRWDVNDIVTVLGEIDKRIVVVEAIERIYNDKTTEELHTLHPLVLNSRWLFGAQYDSPMFVSNSALTTVVKSLFKDTDYDLDVIENPRRRPDIICLKQYSLKAVCTDRIDTAAGEIMKPDQILIVEVKRGGFEITSEEVAQVEHYVRQIRKSAILHSSATIDAYVVGAKLGDIDTEKKTNSGRIHAVTYGHLVVTASQKLFNLRQRLQEHYATLGQESIVEQALKETKQLKMYN